MEREVSICGHKSHFIKEMKRMTEELENSSEAQMLVEGNGTMVPGLVLRFSTEPESNEEFATPCVEYGEI